MLFGRRGRRDLHGAVALQVRPVEPVELLEQADLDRIGHLQTLAELALLGEVGEPVELAEPPAFVSTASSPRSPSPTRAEQGRRVAERDECDGAEHRRGSGRGSGPGGRRRRRARPRSIARPPGGSSTGESLRDLGIEAVDLVVEVGLALLERLALGERRPGRSVRPAAGRSTARRHRAGKRADAVAPTTNKAAAAHTMLTAISRFCDGASPPRLSSLHARADRTTIATVAASRSQSIRSSNRLDHDRPPLHWGSNGEEPGLVVPGDLGDPRGGHRRRSSGRATSGPPRSPPRGARAAAPARRR